MESCIGVVAANVAVWHVCWTGWDVRISDLVGGMSLVLGVRRVVDLVAVLRNCST